MIVLGLETSCDATSAAVVEDGRLVRSCIIASSSNDFTGSGGVIPEQAAREQLKSILPVIKRSLEAAGISHHDLDAIAVTHAPGLLGSLLIGTTTARTLALTWNKPLIPVHHTLGHLSSTWLIDNQKPETRNQKPDFPILALSVSGGHSDLWLRRSHTDNKLLGSTIDDAAGEAFDKGAVLLGLPYPGGPALAALAEKGDETRYPFPKMLAHDTSLNFSFSGLKTSLKYLLRDLAAADTTINDEDRASIAASYQLAICNHLIRRLKQAIEMHSDVREIHLVGGVSANLRLRSMTEALGKEHGVIVRWPSTIRYCTDNGAMIAAAGTFLFQEQQSNEPMRFVTSAAKGL
ncbi:MAG: tRNA (adenosine(37)-N6)-threonylcarbamoyltransferase complex transferase subunit TsaD [Candidatus Peribacteraceae bacterium]|nr:tRNA (adenosine(37)-N6)-threonylcarbamoyltransferase complex transferase subunit TsaD [Candidatus Peribacteraceae bacterium]